jgi:hypothetical protein
LMHVRWFVIRWKPSTPPKPFSSQNQCYVLLCLEGSSHYSIGAQIQAAPVLWDSASITGSCPVLIFK